ncbi:IPT/TIG domain-containing protein [Actinoplanes sp. HUAS TT8]|uniref:IPT/TIG domain-containing protein n=1 Tax=Actinoplanes sp. HUAS TT8 TaxID=3447453 RepID=UPI003F52085C
MSKTKSSTIRRRLRRAGLATGASTALLAAMSAAPAYAAAGTLALSSSGGPTAGGNTIVATIATAPTSPNPTSFTSTTAVYFVAAAASTATSATCPATYPSTAPATNLVATGSPAVKVLATNKIAVTVPAGVIVTAGGVYRYAVCAFGSNTSGANLIASAQYTVGAKPTIASVNGIAPLSGPALGNTSVTVTGTGFVANTATATNTMASIDGVPLDNITVAGNGNSFTATTPAHTAGGPFLLAVTTPGGTVNTLGATTTKASLFNYTNGIVASPNTAPNYKGSVDLDVLGVGFANYTFDATTGNTPNGSTAHVYLSPSTGYNPYGTTGSGLTGNKTTPQLSECVNVLVITNTELLCSLPLNHTYTGVAAAALTTSAARGTLHVTTTNNSTTITSTDAAFTQNDVGLPVSGTGIGASAVVASVQSATQATVSVASTADGTVADFSVGGPKTALTGTLASDKKSLTGLTGWTQADVGRAVSSATATFPSNATIVAVGADGTTATVSDAGTGSAGTLSDIVVTPSTPVSNGTYTITVVNNGAVAAQAVAGYQQSIISSGSAFTVADY